MQVEPFAGRVGGEQHGACTARESIDDRAALGVATGRRAGRVGSRASSSPHVEQRVAILGEDDAGSRVRRSSRASAISFVSRGGGRPRRVRERRQEVALAAPIGEGRARRPRRRLVGAVAVAVGPSGSASCRPAGVARRRAPRAAVRPTARATTRSRTRACGAPTARARPRCDGAMLGAHRAVKRASSACMRASSRLGRTLKLWTRRPAPKPTSARVRRKSSRGSSRAPRSQSDTNARRSPL